MKKIITLGAFLLASIGAFAQAELEKGNIQLNLQTGTLSTGRLYLGADYGINDRFSAGGEISYRRWSDINGVRIAGVGNYRVNNHDKFGVYLGALLGYDIYGSRETDGIIKMKIEGPSGIVVGGHIGLRYYFTDKFGVFWQAGFGNFLEGRIGVTYKL